MRGLRARTIWDNYGPELKFRRQNKSSGYELRLTEKQYENRVPKHEVCIVMGSKTQTGSWFNQCSGTGIPLSCSFFAFEATGTEVKFAEFAQLMHNGQSNLKDISP